MAQHTIQAVPNIPPAGSNADVGGASIFEWSQLILLPIIALIIGYRSLKLKTDASNKERWRKAVSDNKEHEYEEKTMLQQLKEKK